MALAVGEIYEGRVTGIQKFGVFVSLPEGKSGLVHISEVAYSFIKDINEVIKPDQMVRVKIISISPEGKIALSIKQAQPREPRPDNRQPRNEQGQAPIRRQEPEQPRTFGERNMNRREDTRPASNYNRAPQAPQVADGPSDNADFEDRLKKFMKESDSRIADNRLYNDHQRRSRKR